MLCLGFMFFADLRTTLHRLGRRSPNEDRAASTWPYAHDKTAWAGSSACRKQTSQNAARGANDRTNVEGKEKSAASDLSLATVEQPRKLSGLVGSSNLPPGNFQFIR